MVKIPAFEETDYICEYENDNTIVVLIPNAADHFLQYRTLLLQEGFVERETYQTENHHFSAFEKDETGIFINAFYKTGELQILTEENTAYFSYSDTTGPNSASPLLTQVKLTDYGLSYVLRLSDGRFMVIDGGNRVEAEADALYNCLKEQSSGEKPVIAAWVMTHPHSDHFYCFFPFMERYGEYVVVEKFIFNFPDAYDFEHYPNLASESVHFEGCIGAQVVQMFADKVAEMGIPVYVPHTGQRYPVGNVQLRFLGTMDDTIHRSQNINASSLIFTTEIEGQIILWGADGSFGDARLAERYGKELKADILQIPHHGFGCGSEDALIQSYRLIAPRVCLLPASHTEAFTSFTTHRESTNYLMTRQNVEEMITGKTQRTLSLPYEPSPSGKTELRQQYLEGRDNCGARTWVFTGLDTGKNEDFIFSVLNMTYINAELSVELYFEGMQKKLVRVHTQGPRMGLLRVHCALNSGEDDSGVEFPDFFEKKGIPMNTPFAVRFVSNIPVVISHNKHLAAYHSTVV